MCELRQRTKWKTLGHNIQRGTLMQFRDTSRPSTDYVVAVLISAGEFWKVVHHLCPLPMEQNQQKTGSVHVCALPLKVIVSTVAPSRHTASAVQLRDRAGRNERGLETRVSVVA
jgi:hypothetical protein